MKGVYVNNRLRERDQQIIAALMEEHVVHIHRSLWTAEQALDENEGVEFMVTNMPFEDVPLSEMARYYTMPKRFLYDRIYGQSFACLDRIHEQWPKLKVIVYTGADPKACILAEEEHYAKHLIRRGRHDVGHEIDEIRKALNGGKTLQFSDGGAKDGS